MALRVVYILILALGCLSLGCDRPTGSRYQGYAEGEFVYVASALAGTLQSLNVTRGQQVQRGDTLFTLESGAEQAAVEEAQRRLTFAQATLADLRKGLRPTEIESLEAQLAEAKAALEFSQKEFARLDSLANKGSASIHEADRARSARDQQAQRITKLTADLATARLGSRADQVAGAEAEAKAREAALARAQWDLSQKRQSAPEAGLVFDTLYRQGEWVAAGKPIVALLPPQNIKVRAFVPQAMIGSIQVGDPVAVFVDGVAQPYAGKVSFISPRAEYTPPVIYSRETRDKLVFMIEAVFEPQTAMKLHPGQPVDVRFGS